MKAKWLIFPISLIFACGCITHKNTNSSNNVEKSDTTLLTELNNDSLLDLLRSPKTIHMYEPYGLVADSVCAEDSICGYPIEFDHGVLNEQYSNVLTFLISNGEAYKQVTNKSRTNFYPDIIWELSNSDNKLYYLVSFSSRLIAIVDSQEQWHFYDFLDLKQLLRIIQQLLPNNEYFNHQIEQ